MAFYGTLDSLIEYAPHGSLSELALPAKDDREDEPDELENLLIEKVRTLGGILGQLRSDIAARSRLSESIIAGISYHYLCLKYYLLRLEHFPVDGNRAIEHRRSSLEKQLDALLQEKRSERVKCWQDVAKLREEGRRWWKQYADINLRTLLLTREGKDAS